MFFLNLKDEIFTRNFKIWQFFYTIGHIKDMQISRFETVESSTLLFYETKKFKISFYVARAQTASS
jgi:hypothetical protein